MKIIEIYKDNKSTIWIDEKTYLAVFDNKGNILADYDSASGLKILQDEDSIIFYITGEDLVPGNWKFFGTKFVEENEKGIEIKVESSGILEGNKRKRVYTEKDPWSKKRASGQYVDSEEREKRFRICLSCPFFSSKDGTCSVNGNLVIESTKKFYSFCPEEKWGDREMVMKNISSSVSENDIILPEPVVIEEEEQSQFEEELEEYLKGL